jgi:hypothetical protein
MEVIHKIQSGEHWLIDEWTLASSPLDYQKIKVKEV